MCCRALAWIYMLMTATIGRKQEAQVGKVPIAWGKMTGCHSIVPLWSVLMNMYVCTVSNDLFHTLAATSFSCRVTFR